MKAAAYTGNAKVYPDMITSAKSLAINSSVDAIYFLTDGPDFPEKLPDYIHCIDVSDQKYFPPNCQNIYTLWSYMTLMRVVLSKYLPHLDKVLSLDCDTIVDRNIDELWDLDLDGYFMAAVAEPEKSKKNGSPYVNVGVAMYNLGMIRANRIDDKAVRALNFKKFRWPDQDCMNELCKGHILVLPPEYDATNYTQPCSHNLDNVGVGDSLGICENPKIIHFANEPNRSERPIYLKYRDIPWEEIRK